MAIYAQDATGKRVKVAGGGFSGGGSGNVPPGGTTGQVLAKASDTDYDTQWTDQTGGGGTAGVSSFNGRTGAVTPQAGDYTAAMVEAVPTVRTVNGKALASDISLTASDVGAITEDRVNEIISEIQTSGVGQSVGDRAEIFNSYESPGINTATGTASHAEGYANQALEKYAHVEGAFSIASGKYAHAEGYRSLASGEGSHAEGADTTASGYSAHAEGGNTSASSPGAHAEGYRTIASAQGAHAEGGGLNYNSVDYYSTASGMYSHAEGSGTKASGEASHAEGFITVAKGDYSHAAGEGTIANEHQTVVGRYNVELPAVYPFSIFIVGNGLSSSRTNIFRVQSNGECFAGGAYHSSGADYAELFEWADSNPDGEDRAGLFVTLEGERIRIAGPEDGYILGIVSASPSVVGDVYDDQWKGMFVRDVFGRIVYEMQDFPARTVERPGPDGQMETVEVAPAHSEMAPKINPEYDNTVKYQPRTQRPEWDAVGLMGKLVAVDDGTCQPDGYAAVGPGGKATASAERTKYRVMARLDDTHIKIMIL